MKEQRQKETAFKTAAGEYFTLSSVLSISPCSALEFEGVEEEEELYLNEERYAVRMRLGNTVWLSAREAELLTVCFEEHYRMVDLGRLAQVKSVRDENQLALPFKTNGIRGERREQNQVAL